MCECLCVCVSANLIFMSFFAIIANKINQSITLRTRTIDVKKKLSGNCVCVYRTPVFLWWMFKWWRKAHHTNDADVILFWMWFVENLEPTITWTSTIKSNVCVLYLACVCVCMCHGMSVFSVICCLSFNNTYKLKYIQMNRNTINS